MALETRILKVTGQQTIHCGSCENTIKVVLRQLPGVRQVQPSYNTQVIKLAFETQRVNLEQIREQLGRLGYRIVDTQQELLE